MKVEDLPKALDPSVWPMRVKVREFIHYSRKSTGQQNGAARKQEQGGRTGAPDQHSGHVPDDQSNEGVGHVGNQGERGELPGLLAPNKYALPEDNVPGGVIPVV